MNDGMGHSDAHACDIATRASSAAARLPRGRFPIHDVKQQSADEIGSRNHHMN
jgi:hypothetical protein